VGVAPGGAPLPSSCSASKSVCYSNRSKVSCHQVQVSILVGGGTAKF